MWWLAMICKTVTHSQELLCAQPEVAPPAATIHSELAQLGGLEASRALVRTHRASGKGLGHQQGHWEQGQNQEA